MTTPHVHKDCIIAWANGEQVQRLQDDRWMDVGPYSTPTWNPDKQYRVKPAPDHIIEKMMYVPLAFAQIRANPFDFVRYTYDGNTGKLKSVEIANEAN